MVSTVDGCGATSISDGIMWNLELYYKLNQKKKIGDSTGESGRDPGLAVETINVFVSLKSAICIINYLFENGYVIWSFKNVFVICYLLVWKCICQRSAILWNTDWEFKV